jgi:hypothetical protein
MLNVAVEDGEEFGDCDEETQPEADGVVETEEVGTFEVDCIPVDETDDESECDAVAVGGNDGELVSMLDGDTLPVIEVLTEDVAVVESVLVADAQFDTEGVVVTVGDAECESKDAVADTVDVVECDTDCAPVTDGDEETESDGVAVGDTDAEFDIAPDKDALLVIEGLEEDETVTEKLAALELVTVAVPVPLPELVPDDVDELDAVELIVDVGVAVADDDAVVEDVPEEV